MTRDDLKRIIKRLEEAKEGSRELDNEIWAVVCEDENKPHMNFSRSVDAALSLVMDSYQCDLTDYRAFAEASVGGTKKFGTAKAPTTALALCIAALRARLSSMKDDANG